MAENSFLPATTPPFASGRSRSGLAPKRSPPTASCVARVSVPSSGVKIAGGWSVVEGMGLLRFSLDDAMECRGGGGKKNSMVVEKRREERRREYQKEMG